MRILVVEDHVPTVDLAVDVLALDGHQVTSERDSGIGRRRVLAEPYDLIMCDVGVPGRDGLALARSVRAAGINTPMLALAGPTTDADRAAGLAAGFDRYVMKPLTARGLLHEVALQEITPSGMRASVHVLPVDPVAPVMQLVAPPRRRGILSGLVVMAVGLTFILQAVGVPGASAYLFLTLGAAFFAAYLRAHRQYIYLVPAAVFVSFGIALLLPTWFVLRPEVIAPSFVGLLALGLMGVSILAPARRWPLVPAALLGAVALVDLIGGVAIIPSVAAPFFVPAVLLAVGAYLLVEPQG
ncbi:MAG: response regulator [Chloroflexota bacterium]|nr:response regulator [Chloroflexota bacterium]